MLNLCSICLPSRSFTRRLVFIGGEQGPFAKTFSGMIHKFFVAFIPIFVAIDPIGLVAMFMGLAGNASREHRQREGFIVEAPPRMVAFSVAALISQIAHRRLTTDDGLGADIVADFVVSLVLDGLRPR